MDDATSPELAHIATLRSIVASLTALSSSLVAARLSSSSPEASPTGGSSTDTEAYLDAAAPYFAVLKAVNRTASGNVVKCKARVGEVRSEVDKAHLGLQNLVYERRHLEKEIKSCREFECVHTVLSRVCPSRSDVAILATGLSTRTSTSTRLKTSAPSWPKRTNPSLQTLTT